MIKGMPPGSVVIDLAAEQGGNCEPTKSGEVLSEFGVTIDGTINVPATVPFHSSQMFGRNVATVLKHLQSEGALDEPSDDEIVQETLVTRGGEVVHARVRDALGLPALNPATTEDAASEADAAQSETDSTSEPEGGESAPESSSTSN